ncbi:MAG: MoxR family ATPase [Verrucomicrobiota bacterium]
MKELFNPDLTEVKTLDASGSWDETKHRFDEKSIWAIRAALAAERPLLLRGEPGIGKSQLAHAAAAVLGVPFLSHVMDERSERDDLLYHHDVVARLAKAQELGALREGKDRKTVEEEMAERKFLRPGPMWWAIDWKSAQEQAADYYGECPAPESPAEWKPGDGTVVLIDEIDKADPSVPNGLLETLGNRGFESHRLKEPVRREEGFRAPLVMITTNEERELPAAFLRRCLVLTLEFPKTESAAVTFLMERARVHWKEKEVGDAICERAAQMIWQDRKGKTPGAAEYLDLIRALVQLAPGEEETQAEVMKEIAEFVLLKAGDQKRER